MESSRIQPMPNWGDIAESYLRICGPGPVGLSGANTNALKRALNLSGIPIKEPSSHGHIAVFESTPDSKAIKEVAEKARQNNIPNVCVVVEQAPAEARRTIEQEFIEAGFRKHPLTFQGINYSELDEDGQTLLAAFELIPDEVLQRRTLAQLKAERDLHMDHLREAGRRSDAHLVRYDFAFNYIQPGDTVLDVACGLGYGAYAMAQGTPAAKVIAIDNSQGAIEYARDCYSLPGERTEFLVGDAENLTQIADQSIDFVASFETLEHLPHPDIFLAEIKRVLKPAGRILVSVPNQWLNEEGVDPNPHHLQVYDWRSFKEEVGRVFLPDVAIAQYAGGGMKHTNETRRIHHVDINSQEPPVDPEWWLLCGVKTPIGGTKESYQETLYPTPCGVESNVTAFKRDYANPYLIRGLVSIGLRPFNGALLGPLAKEALNEATAGSVDEGAALCVLGYDVLGSGGAVEEVAGRINKYLASADDGPHHVRWRISLLYILGLLQLSQGDLDGAKASFAQGAAIDPLEYSPLIATKTISCHLELAKLAAGQRDVQECLARLRAGFEVAISVLGKNWADVYGCPEAPFSFGMPEVATVADLASRCAYAMRVINGRKEVDGLFWKSLGFDRLSREKANERELQELRPFKWKAPVAWRSASDPAALRAKIAEQEAAHTADVQQIQQLQAALDAAHAHIRAMEASTSWRITAPLRKIKGG
ncbi:MAG: class I SAM-dependent methyltransferase [Armatimonadetes bacterium]|nr:class I SAM-dependent methyltransferase [Armatimonadota bacterium]